MRTYLLDANIFIQAHRMHYPFVVVPGFWRWLRVNHEEELVYSIQAVFEKELKEGQDELAEWAGSMENSFFLPPDRQTAEALMEVTEWVGQQDYRVEKVTRFLSGADPILIAAAMALGLILVTAEAKAPANSQTPKIPNVCEAMEVECINAFELLRREKAVFDWRNDPGE